MKAFTTQSVIAKTLTIAAIGAMSLTVLAPDAHAGSFAPTNPGPINDITSFDFLFNVAGEGPVTTNVSLLLNLTHTFDNDLDMFLIAPTGQILELATDVGGSRDNFTNTLFSDAGATSITAGSAPFTGTFRPEGTTTSAGFSTLTTATITNFAGFNGFDPNGTWRLRIGDSVGLDTGALLNTTRLNITSVPTPALLPGLIGLGVGVWRKRKGDVAEAEAEA